MRKHSITIICKQCNSPFIVASWRAAKNPQFCTRNCHRQWNMAQGKNPQKQICKQCNKEYINRNSANQQFCSRECKGLASRLLESKPCEYCGNVFTHRPHKKQHFCSPTCAGKAKGYQPIERQARKCENCNKEFTSEFEKTRFCCHPCYHEWWGKGAHPQKPCKQCGAIFTYHRHEHNRKFCTKKCAAIYGDLINPIKKRKKATGRRVEYVTVQCEYCGKLKEIKPSTVKRFRFCSAECRRIWVLQNMPRVSSIELKMAEAFTRIDLHPDTQYIVGSYSLDFAFPAQMLAVECDGDYWHNTEIQKLKDRRKDGCLRRAGWHILRITETDINSSPDNCAARVQARLQNLTPFLL